MTTEEHIEMHIALCEKRLTELEVPAVMSFWPVKYKRKSQERINEETELSRARVDLDLWRDRERDGEKYSMSVQGIERWYGGVGN